MSICPPNTYYYVDPADIGNPFNRPAYDAGKNPVFHWSTIDPIGNIQLQNDQFDGPLKPCECLTFIGDTSAARDDLIRSQQRKYNATIWAAGQRGGEFLPLNA